MAVKNTVNLLEAVKAKRAEQVRFNRLVEQFDGKRVGFKLIFPTNAMATRFMQEVSKQ